MKKVAFLIILISLFVACSTTKDAGNTKAENRKQKKLAEEQIIKKAVESRKYVIKVSRFNSISGRYVDLVPSNNFLVVNGEIASMSLFYAGPSYSVRPISGINMNGHTLNYKMESNETKGLYKIQMEVSMGADKFGVFLTIGTSGTCSISLNNSYIQTASYYGSLVPLPETTKLPGNGNQRM